MRALLVTVALLAAAAPGAAAGPAAGSATGQVFVLEGRGHGHGVGMAQDSANAMAAAGQSHAQILAHFYPGTSRGRRSSAIRVAVWEAGAPTGTVTVAAPSGARLSGSSGSRDVPPGTVLQVSADAAGYHVRTAAPARGSAVRGALLAPEPSPTATEPAPLLPAASPTPTTAPSTAPSAAPAPTPGAPRPTPAPSRPAPGPTASAAPAGAAYDSTSPVTLSPLGGSPLSVTTTGRAYRGSLVALSRSGFRLVNVLDVEEYLRGLGEVPSGWPMAALRTQAVAARTYALRAVAAGAPLGYDICADTRCQVYLGVQGESARTTQAARDTAGEVVTYGGRLADTFYSANAGGVTATPGEGFGGSASIPYLRGGIPAPGELDAWTLSASPEQVAARLGYGGRLDAIAVAAKGPSGRATRVRLEGSAGPRELGGVEFQRRLGLRSNLFTVRRASGTAQALPPASAAAAQLAPGQVAQLPALPSPAPPVAPVLAAPVLPVQAAAAPAQDPAWPVPTAVALLLLAAAGTAAAARGAR